MLDFIFKGIVYYNPVKLIMEQIGGVWKMPILWRLKDQTMRYSELTLRKIPHISDKMFTTQLRELEADGYVHREAYVEVPPKTEYFLTEKGMEVIPFPLLLKQGSTVCKFWREQRKSIEQCIYANRRQSPKPNPQRQCRRRYAQMLTFNEIQIPTQKIFTYSP